MEYEIIKKKETGYSVSVAASKVTSFRKNFNEKVKNKEVKKGKDGMYRNKEGFIVLRPR